MMKQNMEVSDGSGTTKTRMNFCSKCQSKVGVGKILAVVMSVTAIALVVGVTLYFTLRSEAKVKALSLNGFRLPSNVIPSHYDLKVHVDMTPEDSKFEGSAQIYFRCSEQTDVIVLHSKGLAIDEENIRIRSIQNSGVRIKRVTFNESSDFVLFQLFQKLKVHTDYVIFIKYSGKIGKGNGKGLYYSKYTDGDHAEHYIANTQLQPVYAREVFPCFDEPEFKATFSITIVRWKNMTSLSNMPKIKVEQRGKEWEEDTYQTSMKMSTYLVAFAIGNFVGVREHKIGIWTPKGLNESSSFALDISVRILNFFEEILDVPYDPPKLDMTAVTFLQGKAMENWGLVIYLNHYLLMKTALRLEEQQREIAHTVSHEIAHQWFGNLVTMKWWSDLWLNEGLATYMEGVALERLFPKLNKKALVVASTLLFDLDCCPDWRKTSGIPGIYGEICNEFHVNDPSTVWKNITGKEFLQSDGLFDEIAYHKGAMVIGLVHHVLGNATFWKFLSTYLKENAYGNVDETNFWMTVNRAQDNERYERFNMTKMTVWTHLPGIPVLSVKRNYQENSAMFLQKSCIRADVHKTNLWHIPVSYSTSRNGTPSSPIRKWLSQKDTTFSNMPSQRDWILANEDAGEFYIVNYDRENWKLLASQLKKDHTVFTPKQRYKLLADANNLFRLNNSEVTVDLILDLSTYLHFEKEWYVFEEPNHNILLSLQPLMMLSSVSKEWKEFMVNTFGPLYDEFVRGNASFSPISVDQLVFWVCRFNYPPCVHDAINAVENLRNPTEDNAMEAQRMKKVDVEITFCAAARASESISSYIYEEYERQGESQQLLKALYCSSNSSIIESLFQKFDKSRSPLLLQHMFPLVDNEKHWTMLLDFIDKRFLRLTNNMRTYGRMALLFGEIRYSPVRAEKLLEIMKRYLPNVENRSSKREIEREVQEIEENLPKMRYLVSDVENWLKKRHWKTGKVELNFEIQ